jgi:hypothetical protein
LNFDLGRTFLFSISAINHNLYITIECDGKYQASLRKMLAKYNQYGCQKPLNLRLEKPTFPLTSDLFAGVTDHIYRLEVFGIKANANLTRAFRGLSSLEVLTLQLLDTPKNQTFVLSPEVFSGLENLLFLRLYALSVPVRMEREAFEPLPHLRCLYFTGDNVACDAGYDDFVTWRNRRKNKMLKKFRDSFSRRNENCAAPAQCRPFPQKQPISKRCPT